ncbi:MAG: cell division topological specificity factor MinE [Nitrospirae bacterium]|nr:cell division topological specificity factor MinE [Nitrospirota bacterium]
MSFLSMFRKSASSGTAKDRLTLVLSYERQGLPPNFVELLQRDLDEVFAKYWQLDLGGMEVEISKLNNSQELRISIPFDKKRRKKT